MELKFIASKKELFKTIKVIKNGLPRGKHGPLMNLELKIGLNIISDQINKTKLYLRKDKTQVPPNQIMMSTKLGKGRYHHLFEFTEPNIVKLK